jgi:hypothetical protein
MQMRKIIQVWTIYPGDVDNYAEIGALDGDGNIYTRVMKDGETWKLLATSQEVIEEGTESNRSYHL